MSGEQPDEWRRREVLKTGAALGGAILTGGAGPGTGKKSRAAEPLPAEPKRLAEGLYMFRDTCNVYVLKNGSRGLAVDFGSGAFLKHLSSIGAESLDAVLLTHPHSDQCRNLTGRDDWPFEIHAPSKAARHLSKDGVERFWKDAGGAGVPSNYLPLDRAVSGLQTDLKEAGSGHHTWRDRRIRPVEPPGHTDAALTYIIDWRGQRLAFCGDGLYEAGCIWQPYHLEWDHWTANGARRARTGLSRLSNVRTDLLLPSHGSPMQKPDVALQQTIRSLDDFIAVKDCICPDVKEQWIPGNQVAEGVQRVLPGLYQFGKNGYALVSGNEAVLSDPRPDDITTLRAAADEMDVRSWTAATATHYHSDHINGLEAVRREFGADIWLHPRVERIATNPDAWRRPWLPQPVEKPYRRLPGDGRVRWKDHDIGVSPCPVMVCTPKYDPGAMREPR